jgi:hypothetical protein
LADRPLDQVEYLILLRVTWRTTTHAPGTKIIMANCGHRGWIAPSGQQFLREHNNSQYVICTECMAAGDISEGIEARSVPGAEQEWTQVFGAEEGAKFSTFLRRHGIEEG